MGNMTERLSEVIGHSLCDLDGRFEAVRTSETNLGNFVSDVVRMATGADVVIMNGGEGG
jgi:5'-nucleotidase